jgi:hypothetical protein
MTPEEKKKQIIELMKSEAWTFKDMTEIFNNAEQIYWETYYQALGYEDEDDFRSRHLGKRDARGTVTYYSGSYGGQAWESETNTNAVGSEFKNIAKEAKENASKDEEAFDKLKKDLKKRGA